jgi:hypothetical protein
MRARRKKLDGDANASATVLPRCALLRGRAGAENEHANDRPIPLKSDGRSSVARDLRLVVDELRLLGDPLQLLARDLLMLTVDLLLLTVDLLLLAVALLLRAIDLRLHAGYLRLLAA